jgi:hypothetical protein
MRQPDDGMQREAADQDVNWRELSEYEDGCRIDPDFLSRLAERRLREGFSRIGGAPGQADLPRVSGQSARSYGERDRNAVAMGIEQQERRGLPRLGGDLSGAPRILQQFRREPSLRFNPRQSLRQPVAEHRFEFMQQHGRSSMPVV